MPIITRLVQGKKNPNRVNLYLDSEFAFALSLDAVVKQNLKRGLELTPTQIESLKQTDQDEYLYAKILNFLSYRPRSVKEVKDRLWKYGVVDHLAQIKIIDRLKQGGYLDDLSFARWFINSRNASRPRSRRLLEQELKAKGISSSQVAELADEIEAEPITIRKILAKKLGTPHPLDPEARQKISLYLTRQGFAWETVKEVVKSWQTE